RHDGAAVGFNSLGNLVGQALPVGGTVVDESDVLALEVLHDEFTGGSALLRVAGHHAEGGLEALFGVFGRRGHGDLRQAGIVVHARGGNGGARVEVTQHALHAFVDDLLRNLNG